MVTCPNCSQEVEALLPVEPGLKLRIQKDGALGDIPIEICQNCINQLSRSLSKGAALRKEAQQKDQNRLMLWRSRVNLVKQAKGHMNKKSLSDAAVSYEKYIRVLEIVYDKKPGELVPELFNNEARRNEMTVIASVYWDLMRIYDNNPKYVERLERSADKLAQFARFTPIYSNIIRRAEAQVKVARNPKAFKAFLSKSSRLRPRCFIATSAFGYENPTVTSLCAYRDQVLLKSRSGRAFVEAYYKISPHLASLLDRAPYLKAPVRLGLTRVASILSRDQT